MSLGTSKHVLRTLLGAIIAFSLLLMPVQASAVIEKNDMAAMMAEMSSLDCMAMPCADEKAKSTCDMTMNCAVGCIGFNLFPAVGVGFTPIAKSDLAFASRITALNSIETPPLRRPPRA